MNIALLLFASLLLGLASVWGLLALGYRLPWSGAPQYVAQVVWCGAVVGLFYLLWSGRPWLGLGGFVVLLAALLVWWGSLAPSNDRVWADDVARMTSGEVDGSQVILSNVRNFDWRSETDYTPRWETRTVDLQRLRSVDMITSYWGMPAIAHVLVSFGFDDGQFIVFSVEIRKRRGQEYSAIGGFFRDYELSILATDERDAVRVRSNVRGEDVYLYRVDIPLDAARKLFLAYVDEANHLVDEPLFYNSLTANCTTIVFTMLQHIIGGLPMDYRLLLSGYLPGYVQEMGGLVSGLSLDELRERGRITDRALAAGSRADFSQLIRQGVPGWQGLAADTAAAPPVTP